MRIAGDLPPGANIVLITARDKNFNEAARLATETVTQVVGRKGMLELGWRSTSRRPCVFIALNGHHHEVLTSL